MLGPVGRNLVFVLLACGTASRAAQEPIGHWDFDEGPGDRVRDTSGNGFHGIANNVTWVKHGRGFAARFRGYDSFVDCGTSIGNTIERSLSLEAWVRPENTPGGEVGIAGTGFGGFLLTHYSDGGGWWYIASGTNQVRATLENQAWQHVVATFDGDTLALIINGREVARRNTRFPAAGKGHPLLIGRVAPQLDAQDPNYAKVGFFQGMVDAVRLYDRAMSVEEAAGHFKSEAGDYGFDTTWFRRVRTALFLYPQRNEAVVEVDYRGLMPLPPNAVFEVELGVEAAHEQRVTLAVVPNGVGEARLPLAGLTRPDTYQISVQATPDAICPPETLTFAHPVPRDSLPKPDDHVAPPLPPTPAPAEFQVELQSQGGFTLTVAGEQFDVTSRFSWPHGDFNCFSTTSLSNGQEPAWAPTVRQVADDAYVVEARGARYAIARRLTVKPDHVHVSDTFTNVSQEDVGVIIEHEVDTRGRAFDSHLVSGSAGMGQRKESPSPSAFAGRKGLGIGLLPVDDLFVIQSQMAVSPDQLAAGTEEFALPPGGSYTFEWALYVNTSGDYYDFLNAFRRNEGRIGTVDGGLAFISKSPFDRRNIPEEDWMRLRNVKYGVIHCLSGAADDPALSIEGCEFVDFPKEMGLLKQQFAELRSRYPHHVFMFHIAHSLYLTNEPDRFADSAVVGPDRTPCVWSDDGRYISLERQAHGWQWYIYYPSPGNSFHDAMLASVDVMMDDLGAQGAFMDGFFWGYVNRWTYNKWDGLSADLDLNTKTITQKKASVLYLSQPSLIEYARRIHDKGGTVVANNSVITRSIAREMHLIHDKEISAGPYLHLAPNATALADCSSRASERDVYRDMLAKLRWGMLFLYYQEGNLSYPSLAAKQFPTTFEQMREGTVIGPERVVTMKSGVYGRPGHRNVPMIHHFDARGAATGRVFLTTVDDGGARTELDLSTDESAVLENVGLTLDTQQGVNVAVFEYGPERVHMAVNGQGPATVILSPIATVAGGAMPITPGAPYTVRIGEETRSVTAGTTSLAIPLVLAGEQEIVVEAP